MAGPCEKINIVGQPWLLEDSNPFISSNTLGLNSNKVSSLMASDHRGWDDDILINLFNVWDQQCIKNIQLGEDISQDRVYWNKEHLGQYFVQSAYRMLQAQKELWRQEDNNTLW